jgi:GNAT superfamily N-acetyltransferase
MNTQEKSIKNHFSIESLSDSNLISVYQLVTQNIKFFSISQEWFHRGTLLDEQFEPDFALVLKDTLKNIPIGCLFAVLRKGFVFGKSVVIKIMIIDKNYQRQSLGTYLLHELINRVRPHIPHWTYIRYGDSIPRYWQPGVDLRDTSLLFFLKKNHFKTHGIRQNLTYKLSNITKEPLKQKGDFTIERVSPVVFENTIAFVKKNFRIGVWDAETKLSFENCPPTTFIAKNSSGIIVGWATHSAHFPGSFGPTGVLKTVRGKGIGGELLKWCMWDMKNNGLKECTILWVVGDTIKFYSKSLGAYIFPTYYPMSRLIK